MTNNQFRKEVSEDWAEVARQRFKGVDVNTIHDANDKWCVIRAGIPQPGKQLKMALVFDKDIGCWLSRPEVDYEAVIKFALQRFKDWQTESYTTDASITLKEALLDEQQKEQPEPPWMDEWIEAQKRGDVKVYTLEQLSKQRVLTHEELKQRIEEQGLDPKNAPQLPEIERGREDYRLHIGGGQNAQVVIDLDFDLVDWYQRIFKFDYNEEMNRVMREYINARGAMVGPSPDQSNASQ